MGGGWLMWVVFIYHIYEPLAHASVLLLAPLTCRRVWGPVSTLLVTSASGAAMTMGATERRMAGQNFHMKMTLGLVR